MNHRLSTITESFCFVNMIYIQEVHSRDSEWSVLYYKTKYNNTTNKITRAKTLQAAFGCLRHQPAVSCFGFAADERWSVFSRDSTVFSFFSSSMAALYEGYTLCGLVPSQNQSNSGIRGIESERDSDHVVVTDSTRSVTLYKVTFGVYFAAALLTCSSWSVQLVLASSLFLSDRTFRKQQTHTLL